MREKSLLDVLEDKILIDDGCWEWRGWHNKKGYAQVSIKGKKLAAHRVVYELLVGPIPDGLFIDHLCRNRGCVRPDHLEPVTTRENLMRGTTHAARLAARTHCGQGHPFDEDNTLFRKDGSRRCRQCNRDQSKEYDRRNPRRR